MRPIRLTLLFDKNEVYLEQAIQREPGLTPVEAKEMDGIAKELKESGFSDFSKAELMKDSERQALMEKKRRLEALKQMEAFGRDEFIPAHAPLSLFIVVRPDQPITCVSNMQAWMFDKLTQNQVMINVTPTPTPMILTDKIDAKSIQTEAPIPQTTPLKNWTLNELKVVKVLAVVTGPWVALTATDPPIKDAFDLVDVKEEESALVFVKPKRFLKNNWQPINEAIKKSFGENCWKSVGKGDKEAHWVVNLR